MRVAWRQRNPLFRLGALVRGSASLQLVKNRVAREGVTSRTKKFTNASSNFSVSLLPPPLQLVQAQWWSSSLLSSARILGTDNGAVIMESSTVTFESLAGDGKDEVSKECVKVDGSKKREEPGKCQLWLPKKRRFCASHALAGFEFCGNHKTSPSQTRVPCPIDSSHTVLQEDVASHVKKCPAARQLDRCEHQLYYSKGINSGSDDDADDTFDGVSVGSTDQINAGEAQKNSSGVPLELKSLNSDVNLSEDGALSNTSQFLSSASKRASVSALTRADFEHLVAKIDKAFIQSCEEKVEEAAMQPQACRRWLDGDRDRRIPYQEKHALQQASLLGNMEAYGLLQNLKCEGDSACRGSTPTETTSASLSPMQRAIVELGAGRGYLSQMLCDCYSVQKVVMVERRAYKFKADRTIRNSKGLTLERLRLDIEDLNLNQVNLLQDCNVVAISKHLCGPATDLSLRCCLSDESTPLSRDSRRMIPNQRDTQTQVKPVVDGIAIATCCHHLCQWKSYVNKKYFKKLGFSKDDFHAITWLTSWALSGTQEHELPDCDSSKAIEQWPVQIEDRDPVNGTGRAKALLSEAMNAMDADQRYLLGSKCKRLIDTGRLLWLREKGMQAKLVEYIADTVSPENKVLLAKRQ